MGWNGDVDGDGGGGGTTPGSTQAGPVHTCLPTTQETRQLVCRRPATARTGMRMLGTGLGTGLVMECNTSRPERQSARVPRVPGAPKYHIEPYYCVCRADLLFCRDMSSPPLRLHKGHPSPGPGPRSGQGCTGLSAMSTRDLRRCPREAQGDDMPRNTQISRSPSARRATSLALPRAPK